MSAPLNEPLDDLLSRAVAATRQLSLPEGPSGDLQAQTLAALREAARRPKTNFLQRISHMPWTSKATALLATAASLVIVYMGLSTLTGTALAFADVVAVLNKVRTATWKSTTEVTGPDNKTVTWTGIGMFLAPSHERTEMSFQGTKSIQIFDGQKDKTISLSPDTKTALVIELKNIPPKSENPFGKTFQAFRTLAARALDGQAGKIEPLGARTIDGRHAQGFRIELGAVEVKIWADPTTSLPVRVEQTAIAGPKTHIVLTDFQVDMDLDESLFSLEIPAGYTVQQPISELDLSREPIGYLADTLKLAAELNNGVFPSALRGAEGIDGILGDTTKLAAKLTEQAGNDEKALRKLALDLSMKLGGAFGFVFALSPEQNDWHYAGKGVKLNTPDTPIFWYRRHKAAKTYHVLHADLSIQEVPAEKAPNVTEEESTRR